jgi:hypothetical protein
LVPVTAGGSRQPARLHESYGEAQGSKYTDPAGWSVEVPEGWHTLHFDTSKIGASSSGTQISNVQLPPPQIEPGLPIQVSGLALPEQGVGDLDEGSATGGGPVFSFLWFDANGEPLIVTIKRELGQPPRIRKPWRA